MKAFIIDLDGTLFRGSEMITGADLFVKALRERELPFLLMTNNSSRTPAEAAKHMQAMGIPAEEKDMFTSAQAAAQYWDEQQIGRRVFIVGEAGLKEAMRGRGFELVEENPDAVIQGIDRDFNYAKLTAAVRHIRAGARSIVTNPDHLLPSDGELLPGAGSIAAAIERATGVQPVVIGKPSPIIMRYAMARLGAAASSTWVVGDNCVTDIGGGAAAGCRTALVLTGLATVSNWRQQAADAGVQPDLVCHGLDEVLSSVFAKVAENKL